MSAPYFDLVMSLLLAKVFSAPSKAMVAGGYLVLDPQYNSFVTALSCRMHARISQFDATDIATDKSVISVASPQFGGKWIFTIDHELQIQEITGSRNPFLEATIKAAIGYVKPINGFSFQITLFSDPGYHTQEDTQVKSSKLGSKLFLYHNKPIEQVPKTGMGLSAGFVTVVTSALLTSLLDRTLDELRDVIHKVAQIAHCDAQGKIGLGFDVATAVYGSILYRRFEPKTINDLLGRTMSDEYCNDIRKTVDSEWNFVNKPCSLPPGINLLMGDVKSGSETPKLVSRVLAWRKSDPESSAIYKELDQANEDFMHQLSALNERYRSEPSRYLTALENSEEFLEPLKQSIKSIRSGLQKLTRKSGADVEPKEQTKLLDSCNALPGCLGGVVPGAGGYDAICIFVKASMIDQLRIKSSEDLSFSEVTWLELSEESRGLVEETIENYEGL